MASGGIGLCADHERARLADEDEDFRALSLAIETIRQAVVSLRRQINERPHEDTWSQSGDPRAA
jgi:hypothetical protein